jgi:hypothetical protein
MAGLPISTTHHMHIRPIYTIFYLVTYGLLKPESLALAGLAAGLAVD